MTEYRATRLTSVFPLGIIAKGEKLSSRHIKALGLATIEDMVRRGVLSRNDDDAAPAAMNLSVSVADFETARPQTDESVEETEEFDEDVIDEDAEVPEIDVMAGIVQTPEPEPTKPVDEKPARSKKNSGGRKAK